MGKRLFMNAPILPVLERQEKQKVKRRRNLMEKARQRFQKGQKLIRNMPTKLTISHLKKEAAVFAKAEAEVRQREIAASMEKAIQPTSIIRGGKTTAEQMFPASDASKL